MRTRPKTLGTRQETFTVRRAQDRGLIAERLAEGGTADRGDIRILTDSEWIGEVKDRQQLNLHQALQKAILKAGTPDTFIVWRKMTRVNGSERRTQDGPVLVALTLDRFLELLKETVR
jgi:hypothetical protein